MIDNELNNIALYVIEKLVKNNKNMTSDEVYKDSPFMAEEIKKVMNKLYNLGLLLREKNSIGKLVYYINKNINSDIINKVSQDGFDMLLIENYIKINKKEKNKALDNAKNQEYIQNLFNADLEKKEKIKQANIENQKEEHLELKKISEKLNVVLDILEKEGEISQEYTEIIKISLENKKEETKKIVRKGYIENYNDNDD